jgi:hypothetical protein
MYKKIAITQTITSVVGIATTMTAYGQQLTTYTNSDPGYVIWEVKA